MEGNIDLVLQNEPLHSQPDTPTHELIYEMEAKSLCRNQEIQTNVYESAANTEIVVTLDPAIQ